MRCEEIEIELDAFLAGELETEKCAVIEQHLRQCSHCRAELEISRRENALYQAYASAIDIPAQPWTKRRFHPAFPGWIPAAAAMVLLAAGLAWYFFQNQKTPDMAGVRTGGHPAEIAIPMDQTVNDLEKAVALLQTSYAQKKPTLDPELVKELDRNLEVTRTAIAECRQALETNPGNDQVIEFLIHDYEKQIDIYKHITEEL
jgi:hypothetical protein